MFDLHRLNNETAAAYVGLVLPNCRHMLTKLDGGTEFVAIGASRDGQPVGVGLARYLAAQDTLRIMSLYVRDAERKQGVGSLLLSRLESFAAEHGYSNLDTVYQDNFPSKNAIEILLQKNGWQAARLSGYNYVVNIAAAHTGRLEDAPEWLQKETPLPAGMEFFSLTDLTLTEQAELRHMVTTDTRYAEATPPDFAGCEPLNSLGVRYNGEFAGWQLTFRSGTDTIRYGNFFVRADARNAGGVYLLVSEVIKRQVLAGVPRLICSVAASKTALVSFLNNFTAPYDPEIVTIYHSNKPVVARAPEFATLNDALTYRASHQPDATAFTFLLDGDTHEANLSYRELNETAGRIAGLLQSRNAAGQRVLLCLPQGLDYIAAFMGCLRAGAIAVCAYPPDPARLNRSLPRFEAIVQDAQAAFVLTSAELRPVLEPALGQPAISWLTVQDTAELEVAPPNPTITAETLAFLMYTSGSTGTPRGVMVTHGAALANMRNFPGFAERPPTTFVSWLPFYHDLGLFFGILHPLFRGIRAVLLDPMAFVQRPLNWLKAISRYRASTTGAPNFAFDLCVRKTTPQERAELDLSTWNMALNGAEPIRAETLERFVRTFAPYGFKAETLYPSYGMAEATCSVSGADARGRAVTFRAERNALENNRAVAGHNPNAIEFVGCGGTLAGQEIAIVNPQTRRKCTPGAIGEIWLRGASIGPGYWNRPAETVATFRATIADAPDGEYWLRTGDLGFLQSGELFVTGRLKDMLIIRGRNHYPQDIELTIERGHAAIRGGCTIAFPLESGGEERLAVVAEIAPESAPADLDEIYLALRRSIAETHDLELYALALLPPGKLPKTSSGKLQRREARRRYETGEIGALKLWESVNTPEVIAQVSSGDRDMAHLLQTSLQTFLAHRLGIKPEQVKPQQTFAHYGLASLDAVALANHLSELTGQNQPPTLAWEYPTIEKLAQHLAGYSVTAAPPPTVTPAPPTDEGIAIVGMSCRFPGSAGLQEFWELLSEGRDAITPVPSERWDIETYFSADSSQPAKTIARWGGFLKNLDAFDPLFFGISPREAYHLDPRQRLVLETAWEALEDAGIPPDSLAGSAAGVYIASLTADYGPFLFDDLSRIESYSGPGTANSILANRLSYFLDLRGPSLAVDTACSGSLVALHMACQSLRSGEIGVALVGGVNVILNVGSNIFFSKADALSPDGRCKTFDAAANGIVRSDGAGMVVLKPLAQAIADNDRIYAVIRGSAVNSDGRSKGIMAPNPQAQEAVLREAYRQAGREPAQVQYVEAHGTGTRLGDPIEVKTLGKVLASGRAADKKCAIGSLKTNIGHTEAAAGIGGVIKTALAIKNRQIPASLHFQQPNPLIGFDQLPLVVQDKLGEWLDPSRPLLAGVSSFGFGGTNAHVVLEEAPSAVLTACKTTERRPYLLPLSAQSAESLAALAEAYQRLLDSDNHPALDDICYTAARRRGHFAHRLAVSGNDAAELAEKLAAFGRGEHYPGIASGTADTGGKIVFVFSGQGSHWLGMGQILMEQEPVFRDLIHECDAIVTRLAGWSLLDELSAGTRLDETDVTQPAIFAIQVAIAGLLRAWGIKPEAIVGQSLGEIAAAHIAGVLSLPDAMRVVIERSRLMKRMAGQGKTALVELPMEQAQLLVLGYDDRIAVAGCTSPTSCVLSGDPAMLEKLLGSLEKRGIFGRLLPGVDVAFHSPQMDALVPELVAALADIQPAPANVPFYSTVTAGLVNGTELDAGYWGRNLREPFLMAQTAAELAGAGYDILVEVSPHSVLGTSLGQIYRAAGKTASVLPTLKRQETDALTISNTLGQLYSRGFGIAWEQVYPTGNCVSLPTYQWQRQSYWLGHLPAKGVSFDYLTGRAAPNTVSVKRHGVLEGLHPLVDSVIELAHQPGTFIFSSELSAKSPDYLSDHRVGEMVVLPGAAYVEMALAMAHRVYAGQNPQLQNIEFKEILFLPEEGRRQVQLVFSPYEPGVTSFRFSSRAADSDGNWTLHATGKLNIGTQTDAGTVQATETLAVLEKRCPDEIPVPDFYARMRDNGLGYGTAFQSIVRLRRSDGAALAGLTLPESLNGDFESYRLHPALLDGCLQAIAAAIPAQAGAGRRYLPAAIENLRLYRALPARLWVQITLQAGENKDSLCARLLLLDEAGDVVGEIGEVRLHGSKIATRAPKVDNLLYEMAWEEATLPASARNNQTESGAWLILGNNIAFSRQICEYLENSGEKCKLVADEPAHYERLVNEVIAAGCRGIIYLAESNAQPGDLLETLTPPVLLAQILARLNLAKVPRLWFVTSGSQPVGEKLQAAGLPQSGLWGFGGVVVNEHPRLRCTRVDLSQTPTAPEIAGLYAELHSDDAENQIALRGQNRYVLRFSHSNLSAQPPTQPEVLFSPNVTYLVTGGLGGLGLGLGRWLVEQGAQHVLLAGRKTPEANAQGVLDELNATGANVQPVALDVTNRDEIAALLAQIAASGRPLRGIFHAAAVLDDALLPDQTPEKLQKVLAPKATGAWLLHELTATLPLEYFVLFSSAAAFMGTPGQSNYAAANAYLDALAHYRRAQGLPALSLNWGPWSGAGMATRVEKNERFEHKGMHSLTPAQGWAALEQALRRTEISVPQVGVLAADWTVLRQTHSLLSESRLSARLVDDSVRSLGLERAAATRNEMLQTEGAARQSLVERYLSEAIAKVFGLPSARFDFGLSLYKLGLDSLTAVEIKNRLETELLIVVPMEKLLQGPSLRQLGSEIAAQLTKEHIYR
jgi:acyl transferase domain-containing protein/acyl-CoA synthetase (AMP-forming)/AMP-acid ligase II/acyl carrier protein/GNAT superfamily N-acetyltransferase